METQNFSDHGRKAGQRTRQHIAQVCHVCSPFCYCPTRRSRSSRLCRRRQSERTSVKLSDCCCGRHLLRSSRWISHLPVPPFLGIKLTRITVEVAISKSNISSSLRAVSYTSLLLDSSPGLCGISKPMSGLKLSAAMLTTWATGLERMIYGNLSGIRPQAAQTLTRNRHVNCCNPEDKSSGGWGIFNAILGWQNSATIGSVVSYCVFWMFLTVALIIMRIDERRVSGGKATLWRTVLGRTVKRS